MTAEDHIERKLYLRWRKSKEREMLNEYEGRPIEDVPEEYREKIQRLRELGQFGKKNAKRLRKAKTKRDSAKETKDAAKQRNAKVKELEKGIERKIGQKR
jgi:hypothetical protein